MIRVVAVLVLLGEAAAVTTPISIVAAAPPRQSFKGFGWSLVSGGGNPFHGPLGNFSRPVREELLTLLCEDLLTTVVRLWWTPSENTHPSLNGDTRFLNAYVDSGLVKDLRRHGVKQLLLAPDNPCAPNAENATVGGHSIALRAKQTVRPNILPTVSPSPRLPASPSPRHPVFPSPRLPVSRFIRCTALHCGPSRRYAQGHILPLF